MNTRPNFDLTLESQIKRIIREQSRTVEEDPLGWPGARGRAEELRLKAAIAKALLADVMGENSLPFEMTQKAITAAGMLHAHGYDEEKADEIGTDMCSVADSLAAELTKYAEEAA